MTRHRLVIVALSTALAATSALAWFGLSKTPANAQGSSSSAQPAPAVTTTGGVTQNVVVAYPNGIIAVVNTGHPYKPEGATEYRNGGIINVYRVNLGSGIITPRVENLENRGFDTETGALLNPAPQRQAPKQ